MRRILAHPDPLTTRIREEAYDHAKPGTTASDAGRTAKASTKRAFQQIDLFDGVTPTQTPAWRDLPEETRGMLTGLMARRA